eukprot:5396265-Pleurochrysis_carterae.AAC.1
MGNSQRSMPKSYVSVSRSRTRNMNDTRRNSNRNSRSRARSPQQTNNRHNRHTGRNNTGARKNWMYY